MNVAILLDDITKVGGVERVVSLLANSLAERPDYAVDVITVFKEKNKYPGFEIKKNVGLIYLSRISDKKYKTKYGKFYSIFRALRKVLYVGSYDVVICCSVTHSLFSCISKSSHIRSKKKLVVLSWEHQQYMNLSKKNRLLQSLIYRFVNGVITLTLHDRKVFEKYCGNVTYIPNIKTFTAKAYNDLSNKKIIAVGRLCYAKGFDMLIDAFVDVHAIHPGWELEIYGDGDLKNDLIKQIETAGLNGSVKLCGFAENIIEKYNKASVFVLSSRSEGFPCVLVEAMSVGLACVCFELPGFNEVVKDQYNGILVHNNDKAKLSQAINKVIEDRKLRLRLGKRATESVDDFSADNILEKWCELFEDVTNSKR